VNLSDLLVVRSQGYGALHEADDETRASGAPENSDETASVDSKAGCLKRPGYRENLDPYRTAEMLMSARLV